MEKPLVFCMVPCCLLPDWEYLVISDFWKKKCADLRIKTGSLKVFFAEIKYGVHRSNGNICVRVVLFFFCGNLDLRKCKFLT